MLKTKDRIIRSRYILKLKNKQWHVLKAITNLNVKPELIKVLTEDQMHQLIALIVE